MVLDARLQPPSSQYLLGTDNLGRDILSRLIWGIRQDVMVGVVSVGIVFVAATGWAMLAGRVRRRNDWRGDTLEDLVMLPRDALCAFPWLVLMLLLTSMVGVRSGGPAVSWLYSLPVALIVSVALLPRAVGMLQEAYRSPPVGKAWFTGLLQAVPVMVLFAVGGGIIYLASVSYLGLGVPPPAPELGGMLSGPARRYMLQAPWMALWPPAVLILLLTAWVMAGETLLERMGFRSKALWSKVWE
jgi:ABC-type dipeptide/oligopeptide/nickel transport system permease subunit